MADKLVQAMLDFGSVARPHITRSINELAATAGITARELTILEFIDSRGTATFAEIAAYMQERPALGPRPARGAGTSRSRLSTAVAGLYSKHGLIDKRRSTTDQRQDAITVSAKGKRILKKLKNLRADVYSDVRKAMRLQAGEADVFEAAFKRGTANLPDVIARK